MLFGYSYQGEGFRPTFSGQMTRCLECSGTLVSKCGDNYVWHWAHSPSKQCDSWKDLPGVVARILQKLDDIELLQILN